MNKTLIGAVVVLGALAVFAFFKPSDSFVGSDRGSGDTLPIVAKDYNQVGLTASRSQQAIIKPGPGRVFAVEVTSDSQSLRYLQLFDLATAQVPTRAASLSAGFQSFKIYKASNSWASTLQLANKPLGSYQQYASPSLVVSIPIPAATSSSSPTVVMIPSTMFSPAKNFLNGIMYAISSSFGSFSSASINPARFTVKVIYE